MLYIPPPDRNSRLKIIKIHISKVPLADDENIEGLTDRADGYTSADIASFVQAAELSSQCEST